MSEVLSYVIRYLSPEQVFMEIGRAFSTVVRIVRDFDRPNRPNLWRSRRHRSPRALQFLSIQSPAALQPERTL